WCGAGPCSGHVTAYRKDWISRRKLYQDAGLEQQLVTTDDRMGVRQDRIDAVIQDTERQVGSCAARSLAPLFAGESDLSACCQITSRTPRAGEPVATATARA